MYNTSIFRYFYVFFFTITFFLSNLCEATKLPELTSKDVTVKADEIMKSHATQKELTPALVKRILTNYLEYLDYNKNYFILPDIETWTNPSDDLVSKIITDMQSGNFEEFKIIHSRLVKAIERRRLLDQTIDLQNLPSNVRSEEFKNMDWVSSESDLINRLQRIRSLQLETSGDLSADVREKALQRIKKHQNKYEEEVLTKDEREKEKWIFSNILKALASSLDSHTAYFTPDEASQFMINVQQKLYGIGALLRDDINGFSITKLVEGGPAALHKGLKLKDRIIAINGEWVVGMDITQAVDLIRGEANTPVTLTIIRESTNEKGHPREEKLEVTLLRGEVIIKESRYKTSYEPFGDGVIGHLKLHSFYQDQDSSSALDLEREITTLKKEHHLKGIILDLRYNSGGLLTQAVSVTGLFITKGIVVSIKDENGRIQHLRNLEAAPVWDGPLIVLVNRLSASASEIVAQTLQDYGRAIIVGDDHTYGKGSYQTFTLGTISQNEVDPQGEYKVTRGRYYTVSGKTPQLTGVQSDVTIPGPLSESELGEKFAKYPLENDTIKPNFDDDLSDVSFFHRDQIKHMYKFSLQEKLKTYHPYIDRLKNNASCRLSQCLNQHNLIKEIQKKEDSDKDKSENIGINDVQLEHTYHVMKDLLLLMHHDGLLFDSQSKPEVITSL